MRWLRERLAELSARAVRTGYVHRDGRRPTDLCSKRGTGERMQSVAVTSVQCSSSSSLMAAEGRRRRSASSPRCSLAAGCGSFGSLRIKFGLGELTGSNPWLRAKITYLGLSAW